MNHNRYIPLENSNIIVEYRNERIIPSSGLAKSDNEIIKLYHVNGEYEEYHSEVKNDKDVERLPSGKFETNALMLEHTVIACNILCMIG